MLQALEGHVERAVGHERLPAGLEHERVGHVLMQPPDFVRGAHGARAAVFRPARVHPLPHRRHRARPLQSPAPLLRRPHPRLQVLPFTVLIILEKNAHNCETLLLRILVSNVQLLCVKKCKERSWPLLRVCTLLVLVHVHLVNVNAL